MRAALVLAALLIGCNGCEPSRPGVGPDRWADGAPRAECTDACGCACENLKTACPELYRDAKYCSDFCEAMMDGGVPICPLRLIDVKSCAEAEAVCR